MHRWRVAIRVPTHPPLWRALAPPPLSRLTQPQQLPAHTRSHSCSAFRQAASGAAATGRAMRGISAVAKANRARQLLLSCPCRPPWVAIPPPACLAKQCPRHTRSTLRMCMHGMLACR